jgi:hypothetical protein
MGCELHLAAQMYFKDPVLKNSQPHEAKQTVRLDFSSKNSRMKLHTDSW